MGAWRYLRVTGTMSFLGRLPCTGICRSASASPATGSHAAHLVEQQELLNRAFREDQPSPRPHTETVLGLRSEEHTSELQSLRHLVCRLLLEKKKYLAR